MGIRISIYQVAVVAMGLMSGRSIFRIQHHTGRDSVGIKRMAFWKSSGQDSFPWVG